MMNSTISVIICTKNRLEDFRRTLVSLTKQNRLPDELIVVDSSDGSNIQDYVLTIDAAFQCRYARAPLGLTRARNVGVQHSRGDLLFFFDDDVDLDVNYIARVEFAFHSNLMPDLGAVGGRIVNEVRLAPATPWLYFKRRIFDLLQTVFLLSKLGNGRFRYSGMPTQPHALTQSRFIECLSGGCMAFRREVFEKIRFDENLIGYGHVEDADISKQVLSAGYKILYEAAAQLEHNPSSEDRVSSRKQAELTVVNYDRFFRKHWRQSLPRRLAFWWALAGLCLMFIPGNGWVGILNGVGRIMRRTGTQMEFVP